MALFLEICAILSFKVYVTSILLAQWETPCGILTLSFVGHDSSKTKPPVRHELLPDPASQRQHGQGPVTHSQPRHRLTPHLAALADDAEQARAWLMSSHVD